MEKYTRTPFRSAGPFIVSLFFLIFVLILTFSVGAYTYKWGGNSPGSHVVAIGLGVLVLVCVLWVIPQVCGLDVKWFKFVSDLVLGKDTRPSTSKIQAFLWTLAVLFAWVYLKSRQLQFTSADVFSLGVPQYLLMALGLSVTTTLTSKVIAQQQATAGATSPPPPSADQGSGSATGDGAVTGSGNLVPLAPEGSVQYAITDDAGRADLSKIQMLTWTVVAIAVFLWEVFQQGLGMDDTKARALKNLPDIDLRARSKISRSFFTALDAAGWYSSTLHERPRAPVAPLLTPLQ